MFKIVIVDSMSHIRTRLEARERNLMRGLINDSLRTDRFVVWAWDQKNGNDARRAILPGYKNRPPSPSQVKAQLQLIRQLLSYTPAWQAGLDGFEGDDIVAALVEHFYGQAPIEILSGDGDLTALCRPGVTCKASAPVPPDLIRLYKQTVGDSSDTIPGIKGFGKKAWDACNKPLLARVMLAAEAGAINEDEALEAGLQPSHIKWLKENRDLVIAIRRVIEPLPLTPEQFSTALVKGVDNPAAREALMKEYIL